MIDLDWDMNELWTPGNYILKETADNLLLTKRKNKQQWMTEEALQKCDDKREAKRKKEINPSIENYETYRRHCREVENKCK